MIDGLMLHRAQGPADTSLRSAKMALLTGSTLISPTACLLYKEASKKYSAVFVPFFLGPDLKKNEPDSWSV